jgi:hypothetical protein
MGAWAAVTAHEALAGTVRPRSIDWSNQSVGSLEPSTLWLPISQFLREPNAASSQPTDAGRQMSSIFFLFSADLWSPAVIGDTTTAGLISQFSNLQFQWSAVHNQVAKDEVSLVDNKWISNIVNTLIVLWCHILLIYYLSFICMC